MKIAVDTHAEEKFSGTYCQERVNSIEKLFGCCQQMNDPEKNTIPSNFRTRSGHNTTHVM